MSDYKPEAADRVRVVLEGEVARTFRSGDFGLLAPDGNDSCLRRHHVVSVEKIKPPVETFKPGDVVRYKGSGRTIFTVGEGGSYYSHSERRWYGPDPTRPSFTSEYYEKATLVFEDSP